MVEVRHHVLHDGRRIAYRFRPGASPALVFLPGYMSDMAGGKATAVLAHAQARGQACLLLDYSGCGESDGDFADGTLSRWRDEVLALIDAHVSGPMVLIGSSMGGWLMLLVALAIPDRIVGLIGLAAAPDFTDWGTSDADKSRLSAGETVFEDNPYGPEPTPTHPGFWADGQSLKVFGQPIPIDCPVRLLQGLEDFVVPWSTAFRLSHNLRSADVHIHLIKDGDHRLSRDADIALLLRTLDSLLDAALLAGADA